MFVLTDGQDNFSFSSNNDAVKRVHFLLEKYKNDKNGEQLNFTINSYGYGTDHDPELMTKIAKLKNGNFYFIKELNKISEWFILSLSGLLTVLAENIEIYATPSKNF